MTCCTHFTRSYFSFLWVGPNMVLRSENILRCSTSTCCCSVFDLCRFSPSTTKISWSHLGWPDYGLSPSPRALHHRLLRSRKTTHPLRLWIRTRTQTVLTPSCYYFVINLTRTDYVYQDVEESRMKLKHYVKSPYRRAVVFIYTFLWAWQKFKAKCWSSSGSDDGGKLLRLKSSRQPRQFVKFDGNLMMTSRTQITILFKNTIYNIHAIKLGSH